MDRKNLALELINKYGIKNFSSKLSDSDYITRNVKKTFGYKKELLFISDEFAEQVITRDALRTALLSAGHKYVFNPTFFIPVRNEIENVYEEKIDNSNFDRICYELYTYIQTSGILKESKKVLNGENLTNLTVYKEKIHNFYINNINKEEDFSL